MQPHRWWCVKEATTVDLERSGELLLCVLVVICDPYNFSDRIRGDYADTGVLTKNKLFHRFKGTRVP